MKFKFKITEDTTLEDALEEIDALCKANTVNIPLNHILRITNFIGIELAEDQKSGSMIRFKHSNVKTYGGYFGVHIVHKGKQDKQVSRLDFKRYLYPILVQIIESQQKNK